MNRLEHLQQTLPVNLADNRDYPLAEFIILDYNSTDGLSDWLQENYAADLDSGRIKLFRTDEPEFFEMATAKNMAHGSADGDIVCTLDADSYTGRQFAHYMNYCIEQNDNIIGHGILGTGSYSGRLFLLRRHFETLGGYDQKFTGWGSDDIDMCERAVRLGLEPLTIPIGYLRHIDHDNTLRSANQSASYLDSSTTNNAHLEIARERKTVSVSNAQRCNVYRLPNHV